MSAVSVFVCCLIDEALLFLLIEREEPIWLPAGDEVAQGVGELGEDAAFVDKVISAAAGAGEAKVGVKPLAQASLFEGADPVWVRFLLGAHDAGLQREVIRLQHSVERVLAVALQVAIDVRFAAAAGAFGIVLAEVFFVWHGDHDVFGAAALELFDGALAVGRAQMLQYLVAHTELELPVCKGQLRDGAADFGRGDVFQGGFRDVQAHDVIVVLQGVGDNSVSTAGVQDGLYILGNELLYGAQLQAEEVAPVIVIPGLFLVQIHLGSFCVLNMVFFAWLDSLSDVCNIHHFAGAKEVKQKRETGCVLILLRRLCSLSLTEKPPIN